MSTAAHEPVAGSMEYPPQRGVNWRAVWGIIRKDTRVVFQSRMVVLPMILVPLLLFVAIPATLGVLFSVFGERMAQSPDIAELVALAPEQLRAGPYGDSAVHLAAFFVLTSMFAPLYLIMPIMTASVIAADSFAGEKERKTLEALLYTPTSDFDLMLAKMLGAMAPAVAVAWASALLYWIVASASVWPLFGRLILPNGVWILLALWVAPAAAAMALGATVIVSARARSMQDAYQISGLVVLPVVLLMMGQLLGLLILGPGVTALTGLAFWAVAAVLFLIGARNLKRQEMIARL